MHTGLPLPWLSCSWLCLVGHCSHHKAGMLCKAASPRGFIYELGRAYWAAEAKLGSQWVCSANQVYILVLSALFLYRR